MCEYLRSIYLNLSATYNWKTETDFRKNKHISIFTDNRASFAVSRSQQNSVRNHHQDFIITHIRILIFTESCLS